MREMTDLAGVRQTAKALLMLDLVLTPYSPMVVQHPFTNSGITYGQKDGKMQILNLVENPDDLDAWRGSIKKAIEEADSPYHLYMMVNPPYALTFLKYTKPYLGRDDFSKILAGAWIMSEYANSDEAVSKVELVEMFRASDPAILMDTDEREQLAGLDDPVTVYRGVTSYNAENIKALSWTLSYDTARWFADRFVESGTVYKSQMEKAHVLALFNGRNESEIILDPKYLPEIEPVLENREAEAMEPKNEIEIQM
ncbi:hypothetical protein DWV16_00435 [Anaerotruncus sp. AF02-27]|uniref:hypothetical protein n=1 Tax=Anaerotruncus sp. AF02-27 TaxID=2292191 RepID=UPI000E54CE34|nr:hypothetical protein [Anaerotruncus sp. AF02-27]RGX56823.1 hypothetical protein DWV16_00435 [Anaerotruncus sp. AF02-27]